MKDKFKDRRLVVISIISVLFLSLLSRLFFIQLVDDEYKQLEGKFSRKVWAIYPSRGLIYDRNGKLLVSNEAIYHLQATPSKIAAFDTTLLTNILDVDIKFIREKIHEIKNIPGGWNKAIDFYRLMSTEQFAAFQERKFEFRGFSTQVQTQRRYHFPNAPHTLGFLGEVNQNEIDASDKYYRSGEQIGKDGIEKVYEHILRGVKGQEVVVVDNFQRKIAKYANGSQDVLAEPGSTLTLSLDQELQAYGELLMQNKLGAIVALDPKTGEILALVSSVSYDPSMLVGRKRMENYPRLSTDPFKPMYNRAISGAYAPGSTYKTIMALVGLQEGVINTNSTFSCQMGYHIGITVGCHQHRNHLNLKESIAQSCNSYYCNVYRLVIDQPKYKTTEQGFQVWHDYMKQFGLGTVLGIDIPGEQSAMLPSVELYNDIYPKGSWRSSYIISNAIGQGEITTTPLQMANFTAIIANKGYYIQPHYVSEVVQGDSIYRPVFEKHTTTIEKRHYDAVVDGMEEVFLTGTARWYQIPDISQCGKTGTAQNSHGQDHSNFIAFAPKENPKIAIGIVVENAGGGATWAAPMASLMIEKYLNDSISDKRKWIEKKMFSKDFIHELDTTKQNIIMP